MGWGYFKPHLTNSGHRLWHLEHYRRRARRPVQLDQGEKQWVADTLPLKLTANAAPSSRTCIARPRLLLLFAANCHT